MLCAVVVFLLQVRSAKLTFGGFLRFPLAGVQGSGPAEHEEDVGVATHVLVLAQSDDGLDDGQHLAQFAKSVKLPLLVSDGHVDLAGTFNQPFS